MLNRKIAAIAIAAGVIFGTTGCSFSSPIATMKSYDPSDGVNATVGKVQLRNFMYLVTATGQGALFGSLVNQDVDAVASNIDLSVDGPAIPVSVGAGEKLDLGYNGGQAIPLGVAVKAGSLLVLKVANGSDSVSLNVPVLDGTLAQYAPLVNSLTALTATPAAQTGSNK